MLGAYTLCIITIGAGKVLISIDIFSSSMGANSSTIKVFTKRQGVEQLKLLEEILNHNQQFVEEKSTKSLKQRSFLIKKWLF